MDGVDAPKKPICGVVMPISAWDGCTEVHWSEVREILDESIQDAGFEANLVSNANEVSVIQKRIVQNLYDNPIVICDVSGRNANVMFELGLRLAFDKPTIIVKDDNTPFSFDTAPIEHLEYPRDLRFAKIVEFKEKLAEKIKSTHEASVKDGKYSTFLKHFGEFTVAKLDKKEVSSQQYVLEELKNINVRLDRLQVTTQYSVGSDDIVIARPPIMFSMSGRTPAEVEEARRLAETYPGVVRVSTHVSESSGPRLIIRFSPDSSEQRQRLRSFLRSKFPHVTSIGSPEVQKPS